MSSCRALGKKSAWFPVSGAQEIAAGQARQPGALACDKVYHVDGKRYVLGGCNREYVGLEAKTPGAIIGARHARLNLECKE